MSNNNLEQQNNSNGLNDPSIQQLKPKLVRASSLQNLPSHKQQQINQQLLSNINIQSPLSSNNNNIHNNNNNNNNIGHLQHHHNHHHSHHIQQHHHHNIHGQLTSTTQTNDIGGAAQHMDLIKFGEITEHPAPSSKYDFVKVKVRLEDHYYVLSRFLISRVLNVTKVDAADSVKISLELKKRLVDQGRLSLTQAELESELFTLLQAYGYGNEYIERYRMTTQFHHQRVPLIILISGPKCVGKSYLATQLAERLNLSTVLQTTLVQDLMHAIITELSGDNGSTNKTMFGMPSDPPIIFKKYKTNDELINEFKKECVMIRHGVDTDIEKCFDEGKAIIIEGPHIDPALFTELIAERNMFAPIEHHQHQELEDDSLNGNESDLSMSPSTASSTTSTLEKLKKPKTKGIIIPFVLSIKERDHRLLVENWLSCNPIGSQYAEAAFGSNPVDQCNGIVHNLQTIQEYLNQGVPPFQNVQVNPHSLLETLDLLHSAVLKRINKAYSGPVKGFEYE